MPNYRGIDVLQYERRLLFAKVTENELRISDIKDTPWYTQEERQKQIDQYESLVNDTNAKIKALDLQIEQYTDCHDQTSSKISYDPLEDVYQGFLGTALPHLLKQIELTFENHLSSLLSSGTVHFSANAKRIAGYELYHHAVDNLVNEYLLNAQIEEINGLPNPTKNDINAIQNKYAYFKDRIVCCLEISNKIRELRR